MKNSVESVENAAEKTERRNIKVMDLILVIVGVSLLVFTIVMIQLFKGVRHGAGHLDYLRFATLGGECGIMGWIKTTKDRNQGTEVGTGGQAGRQRPRRQRCRPAICPAHNA